MSPIETLRMIGAACDKHLAAIERLTLTQWLALAKSLDVATNDREHAAKKLALRELRAAGRLSEAC